jgi:hypothetical protein
MRLHSVALICAVVGVTFACQHSENRYLTRNVTRAEVVGTWTATPAAIDGLRYAGHARHLSTADHEIVIRSDGTCSYRSFADAIETKGPDEGYVETDCTWLLGNAGHQALLLHLNTPATDVHFYFSEENSRLLLWQYAGDPDAWRYVEFAKP